MKNFDKVLNNITLLIISTTILFVFLEIGANVYLKYFASEEEFKIYASLDQLNARYKGKKQYILHRYLGLYPAPNYKFKKNKHNSLGYRGDQIVEPKPKDEFRIACLGGSTTYTTEINDYRLSYPYLLEKELHKQGYKNVRVINAGAGNWGSCESLINLQLRVLDLDPDMIVIYHGINDIHTRIVWPATYRGDNSGYKVATTSTFLMPGVFEYSTLIRYFMIRLGIIKSHIAFSRTLHPFAKSYFGRIFAGQVRSKTYPSGIFTERTVKQLLKDNKPIYFRRNIENMVAIAKLRKIKTLLVTFAYSPLFVTYPRVSTEEFISAYKENNQILKDIAKQTKTKIFDFASVFPIEKRYYTDGRHVNEVGVKLKTKLFSQYIIENNMIN